MLMLILLAGKKKKAPAPPPPMSKSLLSLQEESSSTTTNGGGELTSNGRCFAAIPEDIVSKSQTLPATSNKLSSFSMEPSASSYSCSTKTTSTTTTTTPPEPKPYPASSVDSRSVARSVAEVDEVDSSKITPSSATISQDTIVKAAGKGNNISNAKSTDCTLRRSKKIRSNCIPVKPSHLNVPENNLNQISADSVTSADNSDIENVTPMGMSPIRPRFTNKLLDKDSFRFYSQFHLAPDDDDYTMTHTYVNRRRSEIEARIASVQMPTAASFRKYSEGTLTFSKIPTNFVFPNDGRHLIYDSKRPECTDEFDDRSPIPPRRRSKDQSVDDQFLNNLNTLLRKQL